MRDFCVRRVHPNGEARYALLDLSAGGASILVPTGDAVPEIGTIKATQPPVVILTSNRTREVHDALKRRCLYHWIDYPSFEKEYDIVQAKVPQAGEQLARQVTLFIQELREADLYKLPGVAETLDWTTALVALDQVALDLGVVEDTLGVILKYQDDIEKVSGEMAKQMLTRVRTRS